MKLFLISYEDKRSDESLVDLQLIYCMSFLKIPRLYKILNLILKVKLYTTVK